MGLLWGIAKTGSLSHNLLQPCTHHKTVRYGYGRTHYASVILPHCCSKANEEWRLRSLVTKSRSKAGTLKIKCFCSPRFEWIAGMDIWRRGCHILTDFPISRAVFFLYWSNGSGSLRDLVQPSSNPQNLQLLLLSEVLWSLLFWLCMLIHWVRANVKWLIANEALEQIVSLNMRVLWPISDELFKDHWQPSMNVVFPSFRVPIFDHFKILLSVDLHFTEHFLSKFCNFKILIPDLSLTAFEVEWIWSSVAFEAEINQNK